MNRIEKVVVLVDRAGACMDAIDLSFVLMEGDERLQTVSGNLNSLIRCTKITIGVKNRSFEPARVRRPVATRRIKTPISS